MADVEVLIIGAGFSGICMAIKLLQAGNTNFVVLEIKACRLGGHLVPQPLPWLSEIHRYIKNCASRHGILPHVRFNSAVSSAVWDAAAALWRVEVEHQAVVSAMDEHRWPPPPTSRTSTISARFVVRAIGGLHIPRQPAIKGMEKFSGPAFHSSSWDSSISLEGKTVAVIGTGASSI
ncbi:hypothetical protein L7F22_010752 [Adiantum nelumboides]|nr:hypothetical protein [Adiantum nelumboides]